MKTLAIINYEYPPLGAGAANASYHLAHALRNMRLKVVVITSAYTKSKFRSIEDGIVVYRIPCLRLHRDRSNCIEMGLFVVMTMVFVPWIMKKERVQCAIVFFSLPCGPIGWWGKVWCRVPYVVSLRGGDVPGNEQRLSVLHWLLTPLRHMVMRNSVAVVANSPGLKCLSEKIDPFHVRMIPNGIDTSYYTPNKARKHNGPFRILYAGRLQQQKNCTILLKALSELIDRSWNAELIVCGDGPDKKRLQAYAKKNTFDTHIHWYGWCTKMQMLHLYRNCNCLVNPSFCEGMPNAVMEAMACGLTVIATNVPGNNDVIVHMKNGMLFESNNAHDLVYTIEYIMRKPRLGKRLGGNARRCIKDKYDWSKVAREYAVLFGQEL